MAINCSNREDGSPCGHCNSCKKFLQLSHPDFVYLFPTPNLKLTPDGEIRETKFIKEFNAYIKAKIETPWDDYKFSVASEIRIGSIRMVQSRLSLTKNEAKKRICIIENADRMNNNTANAFLKTLEEPPEDTVIILTTSKPNAILPTILSRCQRVSFNSLTQQVIENILVDQFSLNAVKSRTFSRISYGNVETAIKLINEDLDSSRSIALQLFKLAIANKDIDFLEYLATISTVKQKKVLKAVCFNINIFLMDLIYAKEKPDAIINVDSLELINSIITSSNITETAIYSLINKLNNVLVMIELNVNQKLIITFLYNRIKKIVKV
ncbi:MAG: hypothetical protein B6226_06105 [Candidatus Cloacimonetes bacterium 4572_65]|nr:MAG: hypothetical protein B6226_06105 [Candidatus Cloacimonetes bacterium 4572_65]